MKKIIILFTLLFLPLFFPLNVSASINHNLYYGLTNNQEVKELQQFLIDKAIYTGRATGNFFSLTLAAVKKYQKSIGLNGTGFVGSLTRTSINKELASKLQVSGDQITPSPTPPSVVIGTPIIFITYPKVGATLVKGRTYIISWTSQNIPTSLTATIRLYRGNLSPSGSISAVITIATDVSIAAGQLSWTIPNNEVIYEGQYNVAISYNIGDQYYFTNSNSFNIKNPEPKITITAPGASANLVKGRTYKITWTSQDIPILSTATIGLYSNAPGAQPIITITANILVSAGQTSWTVPDIFINQYRISILSSNGISTDSGVFNIQPPQPKITVTSPSSGATLIKGQKYTIAWTSQDIPASTAVTIYLCRNMGNIASTLNSIITAIPDNPVISAGKVSWTVPDTENIFAYQYIIYIISSDGTARAWSNPFNIKPPGLF